MRPRLMNADTTLNDRIVLQPESTSEQKVLNLLMDAINEHDAETLSWATADLESYPALEGAFARKNDEKALVVSWDDAVRTQT